MRASERLSLALRYTFPSGRGHLTTFLSSLSMLGLILAITLLIVVLSVMNGFDKEMRERILSLVPHISVYSHIPLLDYQPHLDSLRQHPEVTDVTPFVRFDSLLADLERVGNLLVEHACDDIAQDFFLALAQLGNKVLRLFAICRGNPIGFVLCQGRIDSI